MHIKEILKFKDMFRLIQNKMCYFIQFQNTPI